MIRQRIRVRFAKEGTLRFISHHDLMRVFERALRRAGLPLRLSEGYNPRPRMSFPLALGVGAESADEVMEFELSDWLAVGEIGRRLAAQMPAGLRVTGVEVTDPRAKARVASCRYAVGVRGADPSDVASRVEAFRRADEQVVEVERKGEVSRIDLKASVAEIDASGTDIVFTVDATGRKVPRPEFVLKGLGYDPDDQPERFAIKRTAVNLTASA
jgi:radical SAM-linked protein